MSKSKLVEDKRMKLVSVNIWASTHSYFQRKKSINPPQFYCSVVDPFNRQDKKEYTRGIHDKLGKKEQEAKTKTNAFIVTLRYKMYFTLMQSLSPTT